MEKQRIFVWWHKIVEADQSSSGVGFKKWLLLSNLNSSHHLKHVKYLN